MEALSFTVLVAHGGVGVAAAGCGCSSSSLLFLRCFFSLFLLFPLLLFVSFVPSSSLCFFCSLCQQCSSLSAAASWRCWWWRPGEWLGRWSAFLPFLLCVFSSALLSSVSVSFFCFSRYCWRLGGQWQLVVMMMAERRWLFSAVVGSVSLLFFSFVQRRRFLPFLQWCCSGGRRW